MGPHQPDTRGLCCRQCQWSPPRISAPSLLAAPMATLMDAEEIAALLAGYERDQQQMLDSDQQPSPSNSIGASLASPAPRAPQPALRPPRSPLSHARATTHSFHGACSQLSTKALTLPRARARAAPLLLPLPWRRAKAQCPPSSPAATAAAPRCWARSLPRPLARAAFPLLPWRSARALARHPCTPAPTAAAPTAAAPCRWLCALARAARLALASAADS